MRRLGATLIALSLGAPTGASAQPAPEPSAADAPDSLAEARELHEQARARYETHDYEAAIDLWTRAYEVVGTEPEQESVRTAIVFNLASARIHQFDVDGDVKQLHRARMLLVDYVEHLEATAEAGENASEELARVRARIAEIDAKLGAASPTAAPPPERGPERPAPEPAAQRRRAGAGLIGGGAATTALGVGLVGAMVAGLAIGRSAQREGESAATSADALDGLEARGRAGNALGIGAGVGAAVLLGTGVALLVLGVKRRRASARTSVALSPNAIGIGWSTAF